MANLKEEKLKDLIINFLYDYTKNEKVLIVKAGNGNFRFEGKIGPQEQEIIKGVINSGGSVKSYYGLRKSEFCILIDSQKSIPPDFRIRLEKIGFKNSNDAIKTVEKNIAVLVEHSYVRRDNPMREKLQLTEKGLKHCIEGRSFESDFLKQRNLRRANRLNLLLVIATIVSLFFSFWNPFQKSPDSREIENAIKSGKEEVAQSDSIKSNSDSKPSTTSKTALPAPKTAGQK